ncbi:MAG: diadenylate cyclase [Planctomycetaceae bacterium]
MARTQIPSVVKSLLRSARRVAEDVGAGAVLVLSEAAYDFKEIRELVAPYSLVVASHVLEVQEASKADGVPIVLLHEEPQTRQIQLSQSLVEAIADQYLKAGSRVLALYSSFDKDAIDTLGVIDLSEHLAKLTSRDLQRLETQVPLDVLRRVVDLAVEIGRDGREGKPVGTLFVVGQHRKVLEHSHESVHDPFKGYQKKDRMIRSARVRESIKELAQIDGAFVIASDGAVIAAGRILDAPAGEILLSKGLGSRHWAAAAISKETGAVAIAVSESTGTVRVFHDGAVVLRIEPMDQAMKWSDMDANNPSE